MPGDQQDVEKLGRTVRPGDSRVLSIERLLGRRTTIARVRRDGSGVERFEPYWPPGTMGANFEEARLAFIALGRTYGVAFEEAVAAFRRTAEYVGRAVEPVFRALARSVSDVVESEAFRTWLSIFEEEQARRDRRKGMVVAFVLVAGMALLLGTLALLW